jgi:hypothetical protein
MSGSNDASYEQIIGERRPLTRFDLWLVPALLVCIACSQIVRAHTGTLSPWKGGGFGMFASMDAPGMRFFTVQALDRDGEACVVTVPFKGIGEDGPFTSTMGRFQKVIPTEGGLEKIGALLLDSEMVPTSVNKDVSLREFMAQNPWASDAISKNLERDLIVYRPRRPTDIVGEQTGITGLSAVRLQNWRLRFDAKAARLRAEPIGEPIEMGDWR